MNFMVGYGCGGDGFCGQFWVAGFHVVLCLVVAVAVASGVGFLGWLCGWICWVFVAKRK